MSFFKWLFAGLVGAAAGGALWVAVGHFTHHEVGWIAWGIGALAGAAVRKAAGNVHGAAPGLAAVASAAAGVAAAKYVVVMLLVNEIAPQIAAQRPDLDLTDVRSAVFADSFGAYDLLWFGLAMFTAFRVGSGLQVQQAAKPQVEPAPAPPAES